MQKAFLNIRAILCLSLYIGTALTKLTGVPYIGTTVDEVLQVADTLMFLKRRIGAFDVLATIMQNGQLFRDLTIPLATIRSFSSIRANICNERGF